MTGLVLTPPEPAFPPLKLGWPYRLSRTMDNPMLRGVRCTFNRWVWVGPHTGWRARVTVEGGEQYDVTPGCICPPV